MLFGPFTRQLLAAIDLLASHSLFYVVEHAANTPLESLQLVAELLLSIFATPCCQV